MSKADPVYTLIFPSNHLQSFEKNLFSSLSLSSLTSHTKPKPKDREIGRRWSPGRCPQCIALLSCMQALQFGSYHLLTILLPPSMIDLVFFFPFNLVAAASKSTHPWPILSFFPLDLLVIASRSTYPWPISISFSIYLSLSSNRSLFLPSSLNLTNDNGV